MSPACPLFPTAGEPASLAFYFSPPPTLQGGLDLSMGNKPESPCQHAQLLVVSYSLQAHRLCSPSGSSIHGILQARRVDCHSLLQGIVLTQGSNPSCLCFRQILYHLSTREDMGLIKNITLETLQITLYYSLSPLSNPAYPSLPTLIQSGEAQTPFPPTHTPVFLQAL